MRPSARPVTQPGGFGAFCGSAPAELLVRDGIATHDVDRARLAVVGAGQEQRRRADDQVVEPVAGDIADREGQPRLLERLAVQQEPP